MDKKKMITICVLVSLPVLLSAYALPSMAARPMNSIQYQNTLVPTIVPPVVTSAVTVVVPVTGGGTTDTSTVLFYGILILAAFAFLIMLIALIRRPSDRL